jgi:thiamine-phosphate pyrophosphorylase
MVQLRLKNADARSLLEVARRFVAELPVPVMVNDRADVAILAGAAGVHLGADDVPVSAIRRVAPPGFIIGASVGAEGEVANSAEADYVGIGPAFATATKRDAGKEIGATGILRLAGLCGKPALAIGGIDSSNVASLAGAGVCGVAVVEAIYGSPDPELAARVLRAAVDMW